MRFIKRSLSLQLVVMIVVPLSFLLAIVAGILISYESDRTRSHIDIEVHDLVEIKTTEISDYFASKGQIIHTYFLNQRSRTGLANIKKEVLTFHRILNTKILFHILDF